MLSNPFDAMVTIIYTIGRDIFCETERDEINGMEMMVHYTDQKLKFLVRHDTIILVQIIKAAWTI